MLRDVPMVETHFPVVVMRFLETALPAAVMIDHSIGENTTMAFVQEDVTLQIHIITPEETKCLDLFYDKQCVHKISQQNGGCGCYHMLGRRSNIAFDHWLTMKGGELEIKIEHFNSTTFMSYYLTEQLPSSVRFSSLQMMQSFFELLTAIDNVEEYVKTIGT
eukprot:5855389-Ditylum_brightwellii.AAC.1